MTTSEDVLALALAHDLNRELCDRLARLSLPQGHLVAGCLFQAVWNARSVQPSGFGITDYDVFYYEPSDLTWQAEDEVIARVRVATSDLNVKLDVKNQARVHLWYESRFGRPCAPLAGARDGVARFPVECTCVGVELATGELYAAGSLEDLWSGTLRLNPRNPLPSLFEAKAESYRARWPWLTVARSAR
jgi:uncharacterized protein